MSISLGPFRIPITTRRAVDASYEERPHPYHPKFFGGEGGGRTHGLALRCAFGTSVKRERVEKDKAQKGWGTLFFKKSIHIYQHFVLRQWNILSYLLKSFAVTIF